MKVIALGEVYSKYIMDDLPEQGVVIGATKEELRTLPPTILNCDIEVVEKKPPRNCDIFLLPDHAEQGFWAWLKKQDEAVGGVRRCDFEPTAKDVLEWVYAVANNGDGDNKKGTGDAR